MYSSDSERTSLAQDKAKLQRQYRAKEANAFAELQKLLRDISQGTDVPQTRLEIIVQAIETIKYLDHRNTMLQGLREPPLPVPDHSAMKFNSHLVPVQNPSTEWHSFHSIVDERHRLTGMMQYAPVVDSSGVWNPPVPSKMSVLPGRSFQAGVGASGDGSFHYS